MALPRRRDVLAVAQPGSGKTLAYLLTLAARIMGAPAAAAAGGSGAAAGAGNAAAAAARGNGAATAVAGQPCSDLPEGPPAPRGLVLVPTRSAVAASCLCCHQRRCMQVANAVLFRANPSHSIPVKPISWQHTHVPCRWFLWQGAGAAGGGRRAQAATRYRAAHSGGHRRRRAEAAGPAQLYIAISRRT